MIQPVIGKEVLSLLFRNFDVIVPTDELITDVSDQLPLPDPCGNCSLRTVVLITAVIILIIATVFIVKKVRCNRKNNTILAVPPTAEDKTGKS